MQFLSFILIYPFIWLLSILPFRVLHFISDGFYYLLYYVVGYRKKVVFDNLKLAFPEKTDKEITRIAKKSYRHFVDVFVEIIKLFTISEKQLLKRYKIGNIEILKALEREHRSSILMGGHYANWEWVFLLNTKIKFNGYAVYKKINNRYFDKKIIETRGRFNTNLVNTKNVFSVITKNNKENKLSLYGFLADQSPQVHKTHYWSHFLGVDNLPVHTGAELLAKKHDFPIVFFKTKRVKRGYYEVNFEMITKEPRSFKDYDITDIYLRKVEEQIKEAPEYYFWTHKRFKHRGKNLI
ncbi:lipid A biosynthesis acyltransferase [Aureibaculum sp. 2210JD6-5]|uniref:lysophospholipid acyltransferase family protein n=1 Tax=Aureibaculum sp. 2210JD6-5 TaxID=3103957 RepID=UPI002AAE1404|nr:lipid A biosynthesis acyltransferase [Aureibaculum sp. 2210JD6-5]MDY7393623.1 lipid A biosynthesis acyltransferase [Aureibaculum sp. 2210JD6-5]